MSGREIVLVTPLTSIESALAVAEGQRRAEEIDADRTAKPSTMILLAKNKATRIEERIAKVRSDTARDRATAARERVVAERIEKLQSDTRADRAKAFAPAGASDAHRAAIETAARRDGLDAARAVAALPLPRAK